MNPFVMPELIAVHVVPDTIAVSSIFLPLKLGLIGFVFHN